MPNYETVGYASLNLDFQNTLTDRQLYNLSIADQVHFAALIAEKPDQCHYSYETYEESKMRIALVKLDTIIAKAQSLKLFVETNRRHITFIPDVSQEGRFFGPYDNFLATLDAYRCKFDPDYETIEQNDGTYVQFKSSVPELSWLSFSFKIDKLDSEYGNPSWQVKYEMPSDWEAHYNRGRKDRDAKRAEADKANDVTNDNIVELMMAGPDTIEEMLKHD